MTKHTDIPLNYDVSNRISDFLNDSDLGNFSTSCKQFYGFFRLNLRQRFINACLNYIDISNTAGLMLRISKDRNVLFEKIPFFVNHLKDEFKNVSPWAYLLWTLNFKMINSVLKDLAKNFTEDFKINLINQYIKLKDEGLSYKKQGMEITEKHFNFDPIIEAYQRLPTGVDHVSCLRKTPHRIGELWISNKDSVANLQSLLPVWLLVELAQPIDSTINMRYSDLKRLSEIATNGDAMNTLGLVRSKEGWAKWRSPSSLCIERDSKWIGEVRDEKIRLYNQLKSVLEKFEQVESINSCVLL